jgi:hypothetical protein
MGRLFQALALASPGLDTPAGFERAAILDGEVAAGDGK